MNLLKKYKIDDFEDDDSEDSVQLREEADENVFKESEVNESKVNESVVSSQKPVSKAEESTLPFIEDEDVENYKTRLEISLASFKNESIKEFRQIKRQMIVQQRTVIENERKRFNIELLNKVNQIEALKEDLETTRMNLATQIEIKERLVNQMFNKKTAKNRLSAKEKAFGLLFEYFKRKNTLKKVKF